MISNKNCMYIVMTPQEIKLKCFVFSQEMCANHYVQPSHHSGTDVTSTYSDDVTQRPGVPTLNEDITG